MYSTLTLAALLAAAPLGSAYPHIAEYVGENVASEKRQKTGTIIPFPEWPGTPGHATFNKFDPKEQLVSVHGEHEFRAPGPNDIRGPCAGLNAAANHGYLPRDGIATGPTILSGLNQAFGVAEDLLTFLQVATMFFDGDPLSGRWSIGPGSPKTNSLGPLGEALGNQTGICVYGHLKTEGDASITRGDFLAPTQNSNCHSYPEFAQGLLDLAKKRTGGNLTPRVMAEHQYNRKLHSIQTNPNYFSPAYAGVAFTFGAHMFAFQLLANRSAEEPRGILTPKVFESFFAYHRDQNGKLVQTFGHERIPENWYRRSSQDEWSLEDVAISTAQQCAAYPTNCQVGGNTGKVNSFSGVNAGDLTGGFINSFEELSDPKKAGCFISQALQADVPGFLSSTYNGPVLDTLMSLIPKQLMPALLPLGQCSGVPKGRSVLSYGGNFPGGKIKLSGPRGA